MAFLLASAFRCHLNANILLRNARRTFWRVFGNPASAPRTADALSSFHCNRHRPPRLSMPIGSLLHLSNDRTRKHVQVVCCRRVWVITIHGDFASKICSRSAFAVLFGKNVTALYFVVCTTLSFAFSSLFRVFGSAPTATLRVSGSVAPRIERRLGLVPDASEPPLLSSTILLTSS